MKKITGFSLAEMMVVMLIISVVLAAMAPMITTRIKADQAVKGLSEASDGNNPWKWVEGSETDAYSQASRNLIGQTEAKDGDNAVLVINTGGEDKDDILFKSADDIIGKIKMLKSGTNSNMLIGRTDTESLDRGTISIGFNNIVSGEYSIALGNNTTASTREAIALGYNTVARGTDSIAIGTVAKAYQEKTIAIGDDATASFGKMAIALGCEAATSNLYATAMGYKAKASGQNSTALGSNANASGTFSIALGRASAADNSTALGDSAIASGVSSTAVGNMATASGEYSVAIGYSAVASDNYGITLGSMSHTVQIPGVLIDNGSHIQSDKRLKYINGENKSGLDAIKQIKVYNFTYKKDKEKTPRVGIIAQELQKILPDAVKKGSDGFLTIRINDIIYALVNAVKELDRKVSELTETLKQVQAEQKKLKAEYKEIQTEQKRINQRLDALGK